MTVANQIRAGLARFGIKPLRVEFDDFSRWLQVDLDIRRLSIDQAIHVGEILASEGLDGYLKVEKTDRYRLTVRGYID